MACGKWSGIVVSVEYVENIPFLRYINVINKL